MEAETFAAQQSDNNDEDSEIEEFFDSDEEEEKEMPKDHPAIVFCDQCGTMMKPEVIFIIKIDA